MYLQLLYLSIIIGFSYFLSFDFQFAKVRNISETAKTISSKTEQGRNSLAMPLASLALFIVFSIPSDSRGLFHFPQQFTYLHLHLVEREPTLAEVFQRGTDMIDGVVNT